MTITRNFKLCLNAGVGLAPYINVNQFDQGEQWVFTLYQEDGTQYTPSTGAIVGIKADHFGIINTGTVVDGKVVINETQQMTAAAGKAIFELQIDNGTHGTANFVVMVEPKPGNNADLSDSDLSLIQEAVDSASEIIDLLNGETVDEKLLPIVQSETGTWLTAHITNPSNPPIDTSLTISNAAADAKVTGDAINTINDGYYYFDLIPNKYILRDNGTESNYNGWSATDYIPIPAKSLMLYFGTANLVWGAKYNSNKEYTDSLSWNTQFNTFFNDTDDVVYFRTSGSNADIASVKFKALPVVDTTLTKNGYPANAKTVGDELTSVKSRVTALEVSAPTIPSYYESQLTTKETTIRDHFKNCAFNGDGLIFLTDTHFSADLFTSDTPTSYFNANNSFSLINHVIDKCGIDKIVFGGDLVNSATDVDTMLLCMAAFGNRFKQRQSRLRYCVGNHEYYTGDDFGQTTKPTPSELYGAGIKYNENVILGEDNQNTYWFDNVIQKVRYFVISCGRDTEVLNAQASWVMNEFQNIPSDYHVVLIGHAFLTDSMTGFRGQYKYILEAFDALKAKTQYWYDGVTYDYRNLNNVTPVCAITGHTHIDGSLTTTGGIPCICTTTDSYAQNYELVNGTPTASPRTKGTVDEQAFDVFQFDFTNKKIYCTRIGYGTDREFNY